MTPLQSIGFPVWPWLMAASFIAGWWSIRTAVVLIAALVAVQYIKASGVGHAQLVYAGVYTVAGLVAFAIGARVAAFFLAAIGVLYLATLLGIVPNVAKLMVVDVLILIAAAGGGYHDPGGGIRDYLKPLAMDGGMAADRWRRDAGGVAMRETAVPPDTK